MMQSDPCRGRLPCRAVREGLWEKVAGVGKEACTGHNRSLRVVDVFDEEQKTDAEKYQHNREGHELGPDKRSSSFLYIFTCQLPLDEFLVCRILRYLEECNADESAQYSVRFGKIYRRIEHLDLASRDPSC